MTKLLGVVIVLVGIPALGVGIAGIALGSWSRDWRGIVLSALVLALGMIFVESGRHLMFRRAE